MIKNHKVFSELYKMRVTISFESGGGGWCYAKNGELKIGLGRDVSWFVVAGNLLHEILEGLTVMWGLRLMEADGSVFDSAAVSFYFSHGNFNRLCAEAGPFFDSVLPEVKKLYKAERKK